MTNTWLMRRLVRRPLARETTSPISSSVCRLPFISASASPVRTSETAIAAESWLWRALTMRMPCRSMPNSSATARIFASGPTRMGSMMPSWNAITGPRSDCSSHGWATAVGTGSSPLTLASRLR